MSADFASFLTARISEDEAVAHNAVRHGEGAADWADNGDPDWVHIARWDPTRVGMECEAKRSIVREHSPHDPQDGVLEGCTSCVSDRDGYREDWWPDPWPCRTLRAVAAVYADHPDYVEAWRP